MKIHKLGTKCIHNGDTKINFFKNADDEDPFPVQCYKGENEIICGHVETSESEDECAKYHGSYIQSEEWLCCPVCHQWYHEDCLL